VEDETVLETAFGVAADDEVGEFECDLFELSCMIEVVDGALFSESWTPFKI